MNNASTPCFCWSVPQRSPGLMAGEGMDGETAAMGEAFSPQRSPGLMAGEGALPGWRASGPPSRRNGAPA